jgi:hypothetical protein
MSVTVKVCWLHKSSGGLAHTWASRACCAAIKLE